MVNHVNFNLTVRYSHYFFLGFDPKEAQIPTAKKVVGAQKLIDARFEPIPFSLDGKLPECCKLGFCLWKPYIPKMWAKRVCRKLGHKHALPIDAPVIPSAVFAFWLRT
jgi:hypothetical protein